MKEETGGGRKHEGSFEKGRLRSEWSVGVNHFATKLM